MAAPESIRKLIEHFEQNREALRSGRYNEAQLRQEFLNPFFAALGWDMFNEQQYGEAYKEVIHETSVEVEGAAKAPDYAFRVGGQTKFFVEAKKPSVNIENAIHPAYQVKRYAWSAKLPVAILSDFEEFAVYDCRSKPNPGDQAAAGRVMYLTYRDYIEKWDEIAAIFSKSAILKGAFDQYAQGVKGKRGTKAVDDAFLEEMEGWRETLAKNLAIRNPGLENVRQLNYAVQMTIDRIVFLRICEDRGIEKEGQLKDLLLEPGIYARLCGLFRIADKRYNSGLFHFSDEKGQSSYPDDLTPCLKIDDKVLKEIISDLYYPSPYVFKLIPADILGQVYERFLGKVIRLTAGHQARVEEKPEVRKAGGVYYTPTYIVEYIVRNTVGKLLEGKTPAEAEALKIVDPACGSGSFLLGAFQYLIDWHNKYYCEHDPEKWAKGGSPAIYRGQGGDWQLSTHEKKRILLNNLHGVDIDPQAVEVTKLSLLLKVLEEESGQLSLGFERALPDLGCNIQCGNSLIGPDYYDAQQLSMDFMAEEERQRVNAFDWRSAFPQVFAKGGFDAVIGNPPYVFGRDWKSLGISENVKKYLGEKFRSSPYQLDMFSVFMEKAMLVCKYQGFVGQIVPNVWLTNIYSSVTRNYLLSQSQELIILKPPKNVFDNITVDTVVFSFQKSQKASKYFYIEEMENEKAIISDKSKYLTSDYLDGKRPISKIIANEFIFRIKENFQPLHNYANVTRGVHPYRIGGYGKSAYGNYPQTQRDVKERPYNSVVKMEGYRSFIYGKDLKRFSPLIPKDYIRYGDWLAEPRNPEFFKGVRVYSRKILGEKLVVTVEFEDSIADQQVYISCPKNDFPNALYLAGILGSKFVAFFIHSYFDEAKDAFPQIKIGQLKEIPIAYKEITDHNRLALLVKQLLALHKQTPRTPQEKESLQREIEATDKKIDQMVYELYGLTEEEIKIIENQSSK